MSGRAVCLAQSLQTQLFLRDYRDSPSPPQEVVDALKFCIVGPFTLQREPQLRAIISSETEYHSVILGNHVGLIWDSLFLCLLISLKK